MHSRPPPCTRCQEGRRPRPQCGMGWRAGTEADPPRQDGANARSRGPQWSMPSSASDGIERLDRAIPARRPPFEVATEPPLNGAGISTDLRHDSPGLLWSRLGFGSFRPSTRVWMNLHHLDGEVRSLQTTMVVMHVSAVGPGERLVGALVPARLSRPRPSPADAGGAGFRPVGV